VKASTALVEASRWNLANSTISWGKTAVPGLVNTIKTGALERVGGVVEAVKTGGSSVKAWLGGVIDDAGNTLRKFYLADDTGAITIGGKADEVRGSARSALIPAPELRAGAGYEFAPPNVPTGILNPGEAWTPSQGIPVIGRIPDKAVISGYPGFVRIEETVRRWNMAKNDAWIQSIIDQGAEVYVASPTEGNYWNAVRGEPTVFAREVQQLLQSGYEWQGDFLVPRR